MKELVTDFVENPFKYVGAAIMVIAAVACLVRYGKDIWKEIVSED
jgi:hypothetical protein